MPSQGKDKKTRESQGDKSGVTERPKVDMKKQFTNAELKILLEKFMDLDKIQQDEIEELKEKLKNAKVDAKEQAEQNASNEIMEYKEKFKKIQERNVLLLAKCDKEKNAREEAEKKVKEVQWLADKRGAQRELMACKIDTPLIMMEKDKVKLQQALNDLKSVEEDRDKWKSMLDKAREVFARERDEAKRREEERQQTGNGIEVEEEMEKVWCGMIRSEGGNGSKVE